MAPPKSPAHEAQRLFFEIGMETRKLAAAKLAELGLTFPLAHALRLLEPDRPRPMRELADVLFCDASNVTALAPRCAAVLEGGYNLETLPRLVHAALEGFSAA